MTTSARRECIGRFEVTSELGRGSMGIVHRAHDPVMGRDVAIKTVLLPHGLPAAQREEFHTRFLREARAAGQLSHPGIVTVYDFNEGAAGSCPFIAMEFVDGPTLHDLIHGKGALSSSWALSVGETLADALQTAHEAGIVHRDLKPANILVRKLDGLAKISDFGVARVNHSELTGVGSTYGSPAYMAPERLRGAPADARSDLFALAVILYEILCRQRPFGGDDFASTCAAILTEPPVSIRRHRPNLAPAFDRFFARALAKDPEERYPTGAAFRDALRALRDEQECFRRGESTGRIDIAARCPAPGGIEAVERTAAVPSAPPRDRTFPISLLLLAGVLLVLGWAVRRPWVLDEPPVREAPARTVPAAPTTEPTASAKAVTRPPATGARTAAPVASAVEPAHLDLNIKSRVKEGTLTLLLDGQSVYTTTLAAEPGSKRQEITARLDLPPGQHALVARLVRTGEAGEFDEALEFEIDAGATRNLSIALGRRVLGRRLTLTLE